MYISHQFLIAIEQDRLRSLERQHARQAARRTAAVSRGNGRPGRGLGRRVMRAFGRRPAASAAA
jgi:hypothetical protein